MKKLLIILSVIFVIAGLSGILSACDGNGQSEKQQEQPKTPDDTSAYTQLAAPTNLQWDTEAWTLTWDEVEGAESYVIFATELAEYYYSDQNYCNLEHKLTTNSTFNIMVHSVSGNDLSDWSEGLTVKTETSSSMLVYTLMDDGSGYEVDRKYNDVNYGLEGRVAIADYYNGLPVKSIAETAFRAKGLVNYDIETGKNCNTVTTSFHLPKYLEKIGANAFAFCLLIEEINLPDYVLAIDNCAFGGCINLKEINNFSDNITVISTAVFAETAIQNFIFSENVVSIGSRAFNECENLTEIVIPDSVTEIGNAAFMGCTNLVSVTMSENIESFGYNVFKDTAWINSKTDDYVIIGDGILYAYQGEETIINSLPSGIKAIAGGAFYGNSILSYINLSDVKLLGDRIFYSCTSLESVKIDDDIPGYTFYKCENLVSVEFSENIKSIGNYAFRGCKLLSDITFPQELTAIGTAAFRGCSSLTEIIVPEKVISVGNSAFSSCKSLTSVTIYGDIQSVEFMTFFCCSSLTTVAIYGEVAAIEEYAFYCCTSLTCIIIPDSLTSVTEYAFDYCTALTEVYYIGSVSGWNQIEIGSNNDYLTSATVYFYAENGAVTEVGNYWYYDNDGNIKTWSI